MGGDVSRSNTHVANATGMPIWVVYGTDKMRMISEERSTSHKFNASCGYRQGVVTADMGLSSSHEMRQSFVNDDRVRMQRIPQDDYAKFSGEGTIYASVFLQVCECCERNMKKICENYHVPNDRSFIVTKNHNIKLQMYGGDLWVDDRGVNHRY